MRQVTHDLEVGGTAHRNMLSLICICNTNAPTAPRKYVPFLVYMSYRASAAARMLGCLFPGQA
jgi:hypothetical protein